MGMEYNITWMDQDRCRIIITEGSEEIAVLYFERPKRGWSNKPLLSNRFACVDAKVYGELYTDNNTPKDIIRICQDYITSNPYISDTQ